MKIQQINKKTGSRKMLEVLRHGEYGTLAPGLISFMLDKPFSQGRNFRHFLIGRGGKKRPIKVENLCSEHINHMIASCVEEVTPSAQGKTDGKTRSRPEEASPYGLDLSQCDLTFEPVPDRPGWFRGPLCHMYHAEDLAMRLNIDLAPRECRLLAGLLHGELDHRIFITPFLSVREVVEIFRVGTYRENPSEIVARVAQRLTAVEKISPLLIYRADDGDFFADFVRPVTKAQAAKIDKIFATDDPIPDGLENYLNKWSGKGGLMTATVFKEQCIQLAWNPKLPDSLKDLQGS